MGKGLSFAAVKDRSSRPHYSPRATRGEVVEKIVWLRKHTTSAGEDRRLSASQRYKRRDRRWKRY
jgi:hypothetical protein